MSATPKVELALNGVRGQILIGGVDVASRVHAFELDADVSRELPTLKLHMRLRDDRFTLERAKVIAELVPLGITITGRECACDDGCTERESTLRWLLAEAHHELHQLRAPAMRPHGVIERR